MHSSGELNGSAKSKFKRRLRNILINPGYQLKYLFWLTFTGMSLVTINAYFFYYSTKENYDILVDLSPMTSEAKAQLYYELHWTIFRLAGFSLLFLACVGVVGLILSHRTAGPLYHFKRVFSDIKKGNRAARVRLRPKDDFQDVAQEFNEMMDSLTK